MSFFNFSKPRTFKPKRTSDYGRSALGAGLGPAPLQRYADVTLGAGNLQLAVQLPEGEDLNEWLAVHAVDFYHQINMLYGTITEFCTPKACPVMSAGPKYEYHWCDGIEFKKPVRVSAPEYVDYLMTWVQSQLDDDSLFPHRVGQPFPRHFTTQVKTIFKRLFRVYAHLYYHHFDAVLALGEEAHLNTSFKHFALFVQTHRLIDRKELAPLGELVMALTNS
ncbi:uncharacterized protein VTP21DRAFT_7639 [Calcarisporiella thermophila]|uniref:uncharacterized protein n=1 Tax=Calcarisporiella thermophila TaxID=911321 RepID=UPI003743670E